MGSRGVLALYSGSVFAYPDGDVSGKGENKNKKTKIEQNYFYGGHTFLQGILVKINGLEPIFIISHKS
jgi:hypothetical protein